jgi:hypothetical protein
MENITPSYTKTITFSNDQLIEVKYALALRIEFLAASIEKCKRPEYSQYSMVYRDAMDVARQALAAVEA